MKCKVFGVQRHCEWSYQGKTGVNQRLHVVLPEPMINRTGSKDDNEGNQVICIKVPETLSLRDVHVGDIVDIFYNRFGNPESVNVLDHGEVFI